MTTPAAAHVAPLRRLTAITPTTRGHTVTSFELFFDLVYVFALTQVTALMAHEHSASGVLHGLLLLGLLWWTWSAYTWLGNQARADRGLPRVAMAAAMCSIFVVALTIPQGWHQPGQGMTSALILVVAYIVVRAIHLLVYTIAAAGDAGLRRQVALSWLPMFAGSALLIVGAVLGGWAQTAFFAGGLTIDWIVTYLTSRQGNWRVQSPQHFAERFRLFIIIAIGESVVALGTGAAKLPVSFTVLAGAVAGAGISICLWWLYFDRVVGAAEAAFEAAPVRAQMRLAVTGFTYGHFPLIAGILLTALGAEVALSHSDSNHSLGWFGAAALYGGPALYLLGHIAFGLRMEKRMNWPRLAAVVALLAVFVLAAQVAPLAAVAGVLAILLILVGYESVPQRS